MLIFCVFLAPPPEILFSHSCFVLGSFLIPFYLRTHCDFCHSLGCILSYPNQKTIMDRTILSQLSKISDNVSDVHEILGVFGSKVEVLEAEISGLRQQIIQSSKDRGMLLGTSIHQPLSSISEPMLADDKLAWENGMRVTSSKRSNSLI